ncbi:FCP1 [Cyberlindnera jadinii]|uniref:RNA polymerase II subunit A C-terminal domain phosphatase n=1 Tax=Cyberlindnera jadinii (strain ATCC 18201 / CBS 1600 / BCRC 20928 / JCM 3617 / NBRC 0987 / NRRL Y-1542) TaxID=983966 RepID=A0A0H5C127_CYBJN|nr:FCP1 [Cyberlindnera jadinii]
MSSLTAIQFPKSTPFPVKILSIKASVGDDIKRHQVLLNYSYWEYQDVAISEDRDGSEEPRYQKHRVDLVGTFECPIDGVLKEICVNVQDEIISDEQTLVKLEEPCSHSIQYGGLCALCGKSLDEDLDYSGFKNEDRAPIAMSHGTNNLKVSKDEATKVEKLWTKSLVKQRKLILVVDLDQTVIHATVDPTIGEWMRNEQNPNYPSLKDVKSFTLDEETKTPVYSIFKRTYFVKLRPGLQKFLDSVSQKYELHIYTMGTRAYAKEIARCIDPDGSIFADRILSRDESGSITSKSLERLFPTDTSMVVIIDDRGDVWNWSDHLIKVVPYDFFVGIGDINSNFLPRQKSLLGPSKRRKSIEQLEEKLQESGDDQESLDEQARDRPLAKLQKDLDTMESHPERLLYDEDDELKGLEKALLSIHSTFYDSFDQGKTPDVATILPSMKVPIFEGFRLVFSGLLPLGSNISNESIVQWARSFGAIVDSEVRPETTHVIAKNQYTFKACLAKTMIEDVKIVHPDWLFHCMSHWKRLKTEDYELDFDKSKLLPAAQVEKYMERLNEVKSREESPALDDIEDKDDLLGGDMNWLDDEEEEDLSDDDDDEDEEDEAHTLKRGIADEEEDGTKRIRLEHVTGRDRDTQENKNDNDSDDDDDDYDDELAAELMDELEQ